MKTNFPGPGDWSRNKEAAAAVVEDRPERKKKELAPWEKNVLKIMLAISAIKIIVFAIWYFGYL